MSSDEGMWLIMTGESVEDVGDASWDNDSEISSDLTGEDSCGAARAAASDRHEGIGGGEEESEGSNDEEVVEVCTY
jgi:hypothetical protein